jgi:hypothetical protein
MSWPDYTMEDLDDPYSPAGNAMRALGAKDPFCLERLLTALDDFTGTSLVSADRLSPAKSNPGGNEVYLVPQRYALGSRPDSAAVVLVDHLREHISFPEINEKLGLAPQYSADWTRIHQLAHTLAP